MNELKFFFFVSCEYVDNNNNYTEYLDFSMKRDKKKDERNSMINVQSE